MEPRRLGTEVGVVGGRVEEEDEEEDGKEDSETSLPSLIRTHEVQSKSCSR